jgi:hypothetical protein
LLLIYSDLLRGQPALLHERNAGHLKPAQELRAMLSKS